MSPKLFIESLSRIKCWFSFKDNILVVHKVSMVFHILFCSFGIAGEEPVEKLSFVFLVIQLHSYTEVPYHSFTFHALPSFARSYMLVG